MPELQRNHFVTEAYLSRFAESGKILVRRRDGKVFNTSPKNVAVVGGLYDLPAAGGGVSKEAETLLSQIEGPALDAMRWIDESGEPPAKGTAHREALAAFLALQLSRTPETRERVLFPLRVDEFLAGRELTREHVAEYLETVHLGFPPRQAEIEAAFDFVSFALRDRASLTNAWFVQQMFQTATQAEPFLDGMHWTIEGDRKQRFITSDMPLVIWRLPTQRDAFEGVGVASATELRFPVDPAKQLVLMRRPRTPTARITTERVNSCNRDAALACHEMVIGPLRLRRYIEGVVLPARRPVLRFNTAPGYEVQPDGSRRRGHDILHVWVPRC